MTAALVASLEGLDVLLCEKTDQVGGTGSTSAGTFWIPGNSQSKAAGSMTAAEAERYLDALIPTHQSRSPVSLSGDWPAAIDYLVAKTDVRFVACGKHPDYRSNMPGAAIAVGPSCPSRSTGGCWARISGASARRFPNSWFSAA